MYTMIQKRLHAMNVIWNFITVVDSITTAKTVWSLTRKITKLKNYKKSLETVRMSKYMIGRGVSKPFTIFTIHIIFCHGTMSAGGTSYCFL